MAKVVLGHGGREPPDPRGNGDEGHKGPTEDGAVAYPSWQQSAGTMREELSLHRVHRARCLRACVREAGREDKPSAEEAGQ